MAIARAVSALKKIGEEYLKQWSFEFFGYAYLHSYKNAATDLTKIEEKITTKDEEIRKLEFLIAIVNVIHEKIKGTSGNLVPNIATILREEKSVFGEEFKATSMATTRDELLHLMIVSLQKSLADHKRKQIINFGEKPRNFQSNTSILLSVLENIGKQYIQSNLFKADLLGSGAFCLQNIKKTIKGHTEEARLIQLFPELESIITKDPHLTYDIFKVVYGYETKLPNNPTILSAWRDFISKIEATIKKPTSEEKSVASVTIASDPLSTLLWQLNEDVRQIVEDSKKQASKNAKMLKC